jgi:hypothetical protein
LSRAAALFSFNTPLSDYSLTPGQTVAVDLYLTETLTDGSTSQLVQYQGLIGAGVRIDTLSVPAAPQTASYLANLSQFVPSPEFMGGTGATPIFLESPYAPSLVSPAYLIEFVDLDQAGIVGEAISPTVRQVYLGKINLTGGSEGQTGFVATTVDSTGHDFVFSLANPNPVSIASIAPAHFTLTVVPEPLGFLPFLASAFLLKRRKF